MGVCKKWGVVLSWGPSMRDPLMLDLCKHWRLMIFSAVLGHSSPSCTLSGPVLCCSSFRYCQRLSKAMSVERQFCRGASFDLELAMALQSYSFSSIWILSPSAVKQIRVIAITTAAQWKSDCVQTPPFPVGCGVKHASVRPLSFLHQN